MFDKDVHPNPEETIMRREPDRPTAAEAIRRACIEAALSGYDDARVSGLCGDGAWEAAISAIRRLDLGAATGDADLRAGPVDGDSDVHAGPVDGDAPAEGARRLGGSGSLRALTTSLAGLFAATGPPGAGSAAAVTGALAAALVEWTAGAVARRGQASERAAAQVIARRARAAQKALAAAAERDAIAVAALMAPAAPDGACVDAVRDAHASLLKIATQAARVAGLALELLPHVHESMRSDVEAGGRLAASAGRCALELSGGEPPPGADPEWARAANRSAWQTRLLLQRAVGRLDRERG